MSRQTTSDHQVPDTWPRFPAADLFFRTLLADFAQHNPEIAHLRGRLAAVGVDLATLVDHWILPDGCVEPQLLESLGLQHQIRDAGDHVWETHQARLPAVRFKKRNAPTLAIAIESIEDFCNNNALSVDAVHGTPGSAYRCGHVALPLGELMPIERRGTNEFAPVDTSTAYEEIRLQFRHALDNRTRNDDEVDCIAQINSLFDNAAQTMGIGPAVETFFEAERNFYTARNSAAQWQKGRQDQLGIGWSNHDHHTYRCSRQTFQPLLQCFVAMGFQCRERFHAGAEAGWGAQILEHPHSRVVLFVDVDLAGGEEDIDFLHEPLAPIERVGTIGLWCALHGSSIAASGMHHLECEFLHDIVRDQYQAAGGTVMPPFTDLPVLWQAFTAAELWPVDPQRLEQLARAGHITPEVADSFARNGAPGSHLEILQRWEGWKGFHKTAVSHIIGATNANRLRENAP